MGGRISRRAFLARGGRAAAGMALLPGLAAALASCADPDEKRLVFLNWQDYIDMSLLDDFADRTGLTVTYENVRIQRRARGPPQSCQCGEAARPPGIDVRPRGAVRLLGFPSPNA